MYVFLMILFDLLFLCLFFFKKKNSFYILFFELKNSVFLICFSFSFSKGEMSFVFSLSSCFSLLQKNFFSLKIRVDSFEASFFISSLFPSKKPFQKIPF